MWYEVEIMAHSVENLAKNPAVLYQTGPRVKALGPIGQKAQHMVPDFSIRRALNHGCGAQKW
jgi:hypothetical protein